MGMINSFGGDSALVVFGAPIGRPVVETLNQAIHTAIDIRLGVCELNARRIAAGHPPLRYGIGINAGMVVAGNLGTETRFEYTVIGDVVNTAARLQGIARQYPHNPLLITGENVIPYVDEIDTNFLDIGKFELRGKESSVTIFNILERRDFFPPNFDVFRPSRYPDITAVIACHLFTKAYDIDVIAKALEVDEDRVMAWLAAANESFETIAYLLSTKFGASQKEVVRLKAGILEPG